ncbi:hypothetical protein [Parachryseolinea silvisoli]|uniref:hypothetical protein n=1 Tax=Parachryseolinea silvisoli TaxID=2873601 RepID=UPI002265C59E|nr:hypothetical protein [Parachryseolinea silvisoli]MCD9017518.1 hypothetical protein [Parachryseolinea silvisoli]
MSLTLHSVVNGTTPQAEFVWIRVDVDVNTRGYALVDRTLTADGQVSNEFRHIFVFPNLAVRRGDWIRLFTGTGNFSRNEADGSPGNFIYNLYWGANACVYNNRGGDIVTLLRYTTINQVTVPSVQ